MTIRLARRDIAERVKRVLLDEAEPSGAEPSGAALPDDEPLAGERLRLNSMRLLGTLVRLEDELGFALPDDLFAGRGFHTVADLVRAVADGYAAESGEAEPS
ncbi:phosphopantetheine-binding protein [Streptomyces sp. NPDC049577]|uniref:phosphopantetheine-binding protein n=1 Tax=Streptomyces sp. NPDC049577 TaxID=3155153 RepID=UPI003436E657